MFKRPYFLRIYQFLGLLVILGLALSSCASGYQNYSQSAPQEAPQPPAAYDESGAAGSGGDFSGNSVEPAKAERMVVKNASLSLASNDPEASMDRISKMAEDMGGFVVKARVYQNRLSNGGEVTQASINVRVPAEKLNEAMELIRKEASQPEITEDINSEDVTGSYTDLQSRLRNLEAAEAQLQIIMESTTDTTNVLAVYNELVRVREQIEVIKGQMQFYEQSAALSSISVELLANEAVQPLSIAGWHPAGVAKNAAQALINVLQALSSIVIYLVILIAPTLFVVLLPLYLLVRLLRWFMRRNRRPSPPAPAQTEGGGD